VLICTFLYLLNTTIFSLVCITTLHVSALCVGHHQVCLEVKSYNCMGEGEGVCWLGARSRYVGFLIM